MKKNSFKKKILSYNLLLISIILLVIGMYIIINNHTLEKYNNTYTKTEILVYVFFIFLLTFFCYLQNQISCIVPSKTRICN